MKKNEAVVMYCQLKQRWADSLYFHYLELVPDFLHRGINKFHFWEDRQRSLIGKHLLLQVLQYFNLPAGIINNWTIDTHGKPTFGKDFHFNISHSGEWIICSGLQKNQHGIDIEKIQNVDFKNFRKVMNDRQWEQINNASCRELEFFRYWAAKESMIKADGRGLSLPLQGINTNFQFGNIGDNVWNLIELTTFSGYSGFLASRDRINPDDLVLIEYSL